MIQPIIKLFGNFLVSVYCISKSIAEFTKDEIYIIIAFNYRHP